MKRYIVSEIGIIVCLMIGCTSLSSNTSTNSTNNMVQNNALAMTGNSFNSSHTLPKQEIEQEDIGSSSNTSSEREIDWEPTTIKEMWMQANEYQRKEEAGTLSEKEAEKWNALKDQVNARKKKVTKKDSQSEADGPIFSKSEPVTMPELVTIFWGREHGYTLLEIDDELDLGWFHDNPWCEEDIQALRVISVLANDSALVYTCPYTTNPEGCDPSDIKIFVYASQDSEELLYDKKKIFVPDGACAMMFATTTYNTASGEKTTVPVISFINDKLDNQRFQQLKKSRKDMPHIDLRTGEITYRSK